MSSFALNTTVLLRLTKYYFVNRRDLKIIFIPCYQLTIVIGISERILSLFTMLTIPKHILNGSHSIQTASQNDQTT
jgi:hypothetical protein